MRDLAEADDDRIRAMSQETCGGPKERSGLFRANAAQPAVLQGELLPHRLAASFERCDRHTARKTSSMRETYLHGSHKLLTVTNNGPIPTKQLASFTLRFKLDVLYWTAYTVCFLWNSARSDTFLPPIPYFEI